ncbi:hypothetical protein AB4074_22415 [Arthrobacter sp. 2MCAF14]
MHKVLITEKRDTHPLDQGHVATRSIDHEQVKDHEPRGTPQRNKDYMRSIRPAEKNQHRFRSGHVAKDLNRHEEAGKQHGARASRGKRNQRHTKRLSEREAETV